MRSTIVDRMLHGGDDLRALLVAQMTAPELWQEAVAALAAEGATQALALGPPPPRRAWSSARRAG